MRFACENWFYCFIMLIMDQESQKTEARNFPTSMTFTKGQNPRWPPKYTYCLINHFFDFLWFFWQFINEHDACVHLFSKFWKKWSKTERVTCPWLKYCFQEWVFFSGFLSLKGKLLIFLITSKNKKKWSASHLFIFWISCQLTNLFMSYRSLKLKKMLCKKSDFPV